MKKFFLLAAAGLMAASAFSQKLVKEYSYEGVTEYPWYVMGYTPEIVDGVMISNGFKNDEGNDSWYQYNILQGIPTKVGESYTAIVTCKASEPTNPTLQFRWEWTDEGFINQNLPIGTEWQDVEIDYKKDVNGTTSQLTLQTTFPGQIEIKSIKVYQNVKTLYNTEDVATVDYSKLTEYPYEAFDVAPVITDGVLTYPADGDMFYAMDEVKFVPDSVYGIKAKIKGDKAGTVMVSIGDWGNVASTTIDVTTEWDEIELPVGVIPNDEDGNPVTEGFVMIYTKDEESNIYYDGVLEMEYCTLATFTEIPPVVIPTEWVSMVGNCDANNGESTNLVDRDPTIDVGGLNGMANDCYAMICDNPAGSGKVYYCPISADPAEAWSSQFFIMFDKPIEAETPIKVSFDYYCSDERNIDTQAHGMPGNYHHWECVGTLNAKPEWQHKVFEGEVASNWTVGDGDGEAGFIAIAFNLSSKPEAATFYINNVTVEIEREVGGEDAVETVNAIIVPAKGVYNFQGVKVANSLEEVAAPGLYIANGKKVVKK